MPLVVQLRDWLAANDPAFSRLRMGAHVTLTIVVSVLILIGIHLSIMPLPPIVYALGIVLSVEGGVAVRDRTPAAQMLTRLIGCVVAVSMVTIAAALEDQRILSDSMFLIVIFAAAYARAYGQRWFAVGMFAFMSYFMGTYLRPPLSDLPLVAMSTVISALVAHSVRTYLLPDDWRRDLLRALASVLGRVDHILAGIHKLAARSGGGSDQARAELTRLEERLKEAVLMADSFVPTPSTDTVMETDQPGTEIAMRLFDLHLAAESAIVVSQQSSPTAELVSAVMRRDDPAIERLSEGHGTYEDARRTETVRALLWLRDARDAVSQSLAFGRATGFPGFERPPGAPQPARQDLFSIDERALRAALQVTLACGIAMGFGLMLSRERWFWAVLTAFIVFTNTNSRGDTAVKALQRSIGTLLGIGIGLLLAVLLSGHVYLAGVLATIGIFLAFYHLQVSYAKMTFFISIVLCLVYGMTGLFSVNVLELRIEETAIGAFAGIGVAFFVLPVRTQSALESALLRWFDALDLLLAKAAQRNGADDLIGLSRQLDIAYSAVLVASKPLGVSWQLVTRPGHIRQTLSLFMACTYWARIFASRVSLSLDAPDAEVLEKIGEARTRLGVVAARGSDCFFVKRQTPKTVGRHLPLSRRGSRLGIEMIGATLARLYPEDEAVPKTG